MRSLLILFALLLTTHASWAFAHSNNDVVTMYNGDRITGEIKGLANGDLKINPSYAPVIALELQDIASIDSNYNYEILTENNERLYGNIS
jgi:predicted RNA-binding protein (virulence factor B family)